MTPTERAGPSIPKSDSTALGLIAGPGVPARTAGALAKTLPAALSARLPGTAWRTEVLEDELVRPPPPTPSSWPRVARNSCSTVSTSRSYSPICRCESVDDR